MKTLKTIILLLSLLCCQPRLLQAQDTIYKADNSKLVVNLVETNASLITYTLFGATDSVRYVIPLIYVKKVVEKGGPVRVFNYKSFYYDKVQAPNYSKINTYKSDSTRHFFSVNLVPTLLEMLSFSYEHVSRNGKFSIRLPFAWGLDQDTRADYIGLSKFYGANYIAGIDLYHYPFGGSFYPQKARFFFGPAFEYASIRYRVYTGYYDPVKQQWFPRVEDRTGYQAHLLIRGGFIMSPIKHLGFSTSLGLGVRRCDDTYYSGLLGAATFEINLGYKF